MKTKSSCLKIIESYTLTSTPDRKYQESTLLQQTFKKSVVPEVGRDWL